jgi:hypothetical protein
MSSTLFTHSKNFLFYCSIKTCVFRLLLWIFFNNYKIALIE